jgi:hypothetical protein
MTNTEIVWIIVALVAVAIVVVAAVESRRRGRMRSAELRQRFGPEYDRAVGELGSPVRAEHELAARARRVEHIRFRELSGADRARFATSWTQIQAFFVDDPGRAVKSANELIKEVMRARGYDTDDYDQRVADLSVDHGPVIQHYRAARALSESARNGSLNTEDLRQAVVHYRALFADLLQESGPTSRSLHEAHA